MHFVDYSEERCILCPYRWGIPHESLGTEWYRIIGPNFGAVYMVVLVQFVYMLWNDVMLWGSKRSVFIFFLASSILACLNLPLPTVHTLSRSIVATKKHVSDKYRPQRKDHSRWTRKSKSEMNRDLPAYRKRVASRFPSTYSEIPSWNRFTQLIHRRHWQDWWRLIVRLWILYIVFI
jgi:hypothetical protein